MFCTWMWCQGCGTVCTRWMAQMFCAGMCSMDTSSYTITEWLPVWLAWFPDSSQLSSNHIQKCEYLPTSELLLSCTWNNFSFEASDESRLLPVVSIAMWYLHAHLLMLPYWLVVTLISWLLLLWLLSVCVCIIHCRNGEGKVVALSCLYALGDVLEWTKGKWTGYVKYLYM